MADDVPPTLSGYEFADQLGEFYGLSMDAVSASRVRVLRHPEDVRRGLASWSSRPVAHVASHGQLCRIRDSHGVCGTLLVLIPL